MEMKIGDLDRASEGLGRMGFIRGCAVQLGDGARLSLDPCFFHAVYCLVFGCFITALRVFTLLFTPSVASPPSPVSSQNVAINSKRERKEGNNRKGNLTLKKLQFAKYFRTICFLLILREHSDMPWAILPFVREGKLPQVSIR